MGQKDPLPLGMAVLNLRKRPLIRGQKLLKINFLSIIRGDSRHSWGGHPTSLPAYPCELFQTIDEDDCDLRVESPTLQNAYERTVTRTVIAQTQTRQTFISPIDGSVQYYA